jgi:hypothetical protein
LRFYKDVSPLGFEMKGKVQKALIFGGWNKQGLL